MPPRFLPHGPPLSPTAPLEGTSGHTRIILNPILFTKEHNLIRPGAFHSKELSQFGQRQWILPEETVTRGFVVQQIIAELNS